VRSCRNHESFEDISVSRAVTAAAPFPATSNRQHNTCRRFNACSSAKQHTDRALAHLPLTQQIYLKEDTAGEFPLQHRSRRATQARNVTAQRLNAPCRAKSYQAKPKTKPVATFGRATVSGSNRRHEGAG
jgi:hypothetical protein